MSLAALILAALVGCAGPAGPSAPAALTPGPRSEPEDQDLWSLVPGDATTLVWADLAQLRTSPWTRAALNQAALQERAARVAAQGFDELADVDSLLYASRQELVSGGALFVTQGRFDRDRLSDAFRKQGQDESSNYRGVPILGRADAPEAEQALGFLTGRTVLAGSPDVVRAAIDCGFRLAPCVDAKPWLASLRGALADAAGSSQKAPALVAALHLGPATRERLQAEMGEGGALEHAGVRVDLAGDLDVVATGSLPTEKQASDMAARLSVLIREQRDRPIVFVLGLRQVVGGVRVVARGRLLEARLHVPEDQRDMIVDRMAVLSERLGRAWAGRAVPEAPRP